MRGDKVDVGEFLGGSARYIQSTNPRLPGRTAAQASRVRCGRSPTGGALYRIHKPETGARRRRGRAVIGEKEFQTYDAIFVEH